MLSPTGAEVLLPLTTLLALIAAHGPTRFTPSVGYRFFLTGTATHRLLNTDVTIVDHQRRTVLVLPSSWGGEDSLQKSIVNLRVDAPARIETDTSGTMTVVHAANSAIHLHYQLQQDFPGPLRVPLTHRAVVDSLRIVFNAQNGLVMPELDGDAAITVSFDWLRLPKAWTVITSFGEGIHAARRTTGTRLMNASLAAGAFRTLARRGAHSELTVAVQGSFRFTDSALVAMQQRIWRTDRAMWGDDPFGGAFVVIIPVAQRGTIGGTAFTGGYVAFADTASLLGTLGRLVAHELLHLWNGQGMTSANPEGRYKWFTEGFTDFYADRVFHDAGGTTDSGLVAAANDVFRKYYLSPFLGTSRDTVTTKYWTTPGMNRYPYVQGYTFAWFLDGALRSATAGHYTIDSLILATYRLGHDNNRRFSDSLLYAAAPPNVVATLREAISKYIDAGEAIPGAAAFGDRCLGVQSTAIRPFDVGFEASSSTRDRIAHGVVTGGAAYRAGLREGMTLKGWSWVNDDPTREASVTVNDSTGNHKLSFYPVRTDSVVVPQLFRTC